MEVVVTPAAGSRGALVALTADRAPKILVTPLDGAPLVVRAPEPGDPRPHHPLVREGALLERLGSAERAIVIGLGHVARHLGPLLAGIGFSVIVCDDGETGATEVGVPWASEVIESFDAAEIEQRVGGFTVDDFVMIVTRDHAIDLRLLGQLLLNDAPMFRGFPSSVGVANVKVWWDELTSRPAYLTELPEGAGLRELIAHVLSLPKA